MSGPSPDINSGSFLEGARREENMWLTGDGQRLCVGQSVGLCGLRCLILTIQLCNLVVELLCLFVLVVLCVFLFFCFFSGLRGRFANPPCGFPPLITRRNA